MKIGIGCDHAALGMKQEIAAYLKEKGYEVQDYGTYTSERADYPVYAEKVALGVTSQEVDLGILFCGTGIGMSLAANKVNGIRACACSEPYSARLSRMHNNANVLCLGARVIGDELAKMIVDAFLEASFEGGRHADRVALIMDIESRN